MSSIHLDPCPLGYVYTSDWEALQRFYPLQLIREPTMTLRKRKFDQNY